MLRMILFLFIYLFAAASWLAPSAALAAEAEQKMIYEVYAGGIHAVQGELLMNTASPSRYDIALDAKTRGFLAKLVPWEGRFSSEGWKVERGKRYKPSQHQSVGRWKEDTEVKTYSYKKDGSFIGLEEVENGKVKKKEAVPHEVTDQTTDVLSAALEVFTHYSQSGTCEGTAEVFDGKRRFEQVFKDEGQVELTASKYNIFSGPARQCTVEIKPLAGKWSEKPRGWLSIQEQGRDKGTMPTVWIAQLQKGAPAVPVKVRVKTDYGTFFIHLSEYQSADQLVVAEKRAERVDEQ